MFRYRGAQEAFENTTNLLQIELSLRFKLDNGDPSGEEKFMKRVVKTVMQKISLLQICDCFWG